MGTQAMQSAIGYGPDDRCVVALLPVVKRVAMKMRAHLPSHIELDDLIGAGVVGLVDAVGKFDARRRVRIEDYARHRIRGAILDSLRSLDYASRDMRKKIKRVEEIGRGLENKLCRPASDEEMAEGLSISLKRWHRSAQELHAVGVDWRRPMAPFGGKRTRQPDEENLVAETQESPFDLTYRREQREILNRLMGRLPERERTIVWLYHRKEMTMKQIGGKLKIDESRVSQLHSAAVARLRAYLRQSLLPSSPSRIHRNSVAPE